MFPAPGLRDPGTGCSREQLSSSSRDQLFPGTVFPGIVVRGNSVSGGGSLQRFLALRSSSREQLLPGTVVPGNSCSRQFRDPGTTVQLPRASQQSRQWVPTVGPSHGPGSESLAPGSGTREQPVPGNSCSRRVPGPGNNREQLFSGTVVPGYSCSRVPVVPGQQLSSSSREQWFPGTVFPAVGPCSGSWH